MYYKLFHSHIANTFFWKQLNLLLPVTVWNHESICLRVPWQFLYEKKTSQQKLWYITKLLCPNAINYHFQLDSFNCIIPSCFIRPTFSGKDSLSLALWLLGASLTNSLLLINAPHPHQLLDLQSWGLGLIRVKYLKRVIVGRSNILLCICISLVSPY